MKLQDLEAKDLSKKMDIETGSSSERQGPLTMDAPVCARPGVSRSWIC